MRANEFVKNKGINAARVHLEIMDAEGWCNCFYENLKRLVESHDLVVVWRMPESWRNEYDGDILGLEGAKMYLEMHEGHELVGHELERFKQAIADVESCQ